MYSVGYFEIQSSDPLRDSVFYHTLFGWIFTRQTITPVEYYQVQTGSINGGMLKRPASLPPAGSGTNAFVCSVEVDDYDAMAASVIANGGRIALPKFAIPGKCWQGYFLDPDNNTFGIFQVDLNAK